MNQSVTKWNYKPLGDICNIVGGGTPSKKNESFYQGNIPWATVRDMNQDIITETSFKITEDAVRNSSTNIIKSNNVVIATRVGLGKVCLLGKDTAINQDLRGIIPKKKDVISVFFLFWWLKSIAHIIEQEGTGATVKGVKLPFVKSLRVPLPPLLEQQRIVSILDEVFEGIGNAVTNVERNLENSRELFESYLNGVFERKGDGWIEKKLKDFGKTQTGSTPKTSQQDNFGSHIPFIKPGDFYPDGRLNYQNMGLSKKGLNASRLIEPGSVLMVCIGATIGKVGFNDREVTFNQQINSFTPNPKIPFKLIYFQMRTSSFQRTVMHNSGQATLPIINKTKWSNLKISVPTDNTESERIISRLEDLQEEIKYVGSIYTQKISLLNELKQSILQKAFTGELTAKTADKIMEPV